MRGPKNTKYRKTCAVTQTHPLGKMASNDAHVPIEILNGRLSSLSNIYTHSLMKLLYCGIHMFVKLCGIVPIRDFIIGGAHIKNVLKNHSSHLPH